jgi:AcrR family transcriptional regulator
MPKRDAAYMEDQREAILRATVDCMLDLGLAATSMRAIAQRTGVTTGAVYTHFESREELLIAATATQLTISLDPVDTWKDFTGILLGFIAEIETNPRYRSIQRAMYEFVATVDLADRSIPALNAHVAIITGFVRGSLAAMHARGEVSLPLGLDMSTQVYVQLMGGATLSLFAIPGATAAEVGKTLLAAMVHVAGHEERR